MALYRKGQKCKYGVVQKRQIYFEIGILSIILSKCRFQWRGFLGQDCLCRVLLVLGTVYVSYLKVQSTVFLSLSMHTQTIKHVLVNNLYVPFWSSTVIQGGILAALYFYGQSSLQYWTFFYNLWSWLNFPFSSPFISFKPRCYKTMHECGITSCDSR